MSNQPIINDPADTPETAVDAPESAEPDQADPQPDLADQLAQALSERDAARAELVRHQVAAEHSVPVDLLTGTDEEGLQRQAAKLAEFAKSQRGVPDFGAGRRGEEPNHDPDPVRSALRRGR